MSVLISSFIGSKFSNKNMITRKMKTWLFNSRKKVLRGGKTDNFLITRFNFRFRSIFDVYKTVDKLVVQYSSSVFYRREPSIRRTVCNWIIFYQILMTHHFVYFLIHLRLHYSDFSFVLREFRSHLETGFFERRVVCLLIGLEYFNSFCTSGQPRTR